MNIEKIREHLEIKNSKMPRTKSGAIDGNSLLAAMKGNRLNSGEGYIATSDGDYAYVSGSVPNPGNADTPDYVGKPKKLNELIDLSDVSNPEAGKVFGLEDDDYLDPPDGMIDGRYMYADMGGDPYVEKEWTDSRKIMEKMFNEGLKDIPDDSFVEISRERLSNIVELANQRAGKTMDTMESIDKAYRPKNHYDYRRLANRYAQMAANGPLVLTDEDMEVDYDEQDQDVSWEGMM